MKKPYLKKIAVISKITVWIVDGEYIRNHINEEFTNFGQHYRFPFIPTNEFWIDKEYAPDETKYFIDHLLIEHRLMARGASYTHALAYADRAERAERYKDTSRKILRQAPSKKKLIKNIHKKLLTRYESGLSVWLIRGELVRDIYFIDFTEGGHDKVYVFVPHNEIWIDDDVRSKERKFVLVHELHERRRMEQGWNYQKAHRSASEIEYTSRHHARVLHAQLKKEIAIQNKKV